MVPFRAEVSRTNELVANSILVLPKSQINALPSGETIMLSFEGDNIIEKAREETMNNGLGKAYRLDIGMDSLLVMDIGKPVGYITNL